MHNEEGNSQQTAGKLFTQNFVLVFLAYFTFVAANHAFMPALPIYLTKLGSSERQIGVLVGIMGVAALVSRLFVGEVLRKYSKKSAMIFGAALFALTFIVTIVLRPFWPFFAVRVFQGIAFASLHTAAFAYCVSIVPPAYWGQGISYFMLAPNIAMALAAPFGIFIMNRYGFTPFFLTLAGLSLCSFFLPWSINEQKIAVRTGNTQEIRGTSFIEWKIIIPAIANFLQMFTFGAIVAFVPLYAVQCGISNPGLFFTANATVIMICRAFGGKILDAYDKEKMILTFIFINMVTMITLSFSKTFPMFILVGLLWGTGGAFFMPASMAHAFEYAGSSNATAVGTFQAFTDLGMALGPAIMGMIVPLTGYPIMFLCLAFICCMDLVYFQFFVRRKGRKTVIYTGEQVL